MDTQPSAIVSKGEYARLRGWHPSMVSKVIKQRKLAPPALMPDGRINVGLANAMLGPRLAQLQPTLRPAPAEPAAEPAADPSDAPAEDGYATHRARREAATAERAELELAELRGRLVDKSAVDREVADLVGRLRDAFLMLPRELAAHCAALTDERAIEGVLTLAIERVLTDQARAAELADAA